MKDRERKERKERDNMPRKRLEKIVTIEENVPGGWWAAEANAAELADVAAEATTEDEIFKTKAD